MARNKLTDLNNHLFAQLERLSDEELTAEQLADEMKRANSINNVARSIIDNAKTSLAGADFAYKYQSSGKLMPEQFGVMRINLHEQKEDQDNTDK